MCSDLRQRTRRLCFPTWKFLIADLTSLGKYALTGGIRNALPGIRPRPAAEKPDDTRKAMQPDCRGNRLLDRQDGTNLLGIPERGRFHEEKTCQRFFGAFTGIGDVSAWGAGRKKGQQFTGD